MNFPVRTGNLSAARFGPYPCLSFLFASCILPFFAFGFPSAFLESASAAAPPVSVPILNSYHPGYAFSDDETAGIREVFEKQVPDADLSVLYMDTKRSPEAEHVNQLEHFYATKSYIKNSPLVFCLDNPAFEFAMERRKRLFPGAAIVFCGVNGYTPSMVEGKPYVTGVAEILDIPGTVKLITKLHPEAREIFVVHDFTVTGLETRKELEAVIPEYFRRTRFRFNKNVSVSELLLQIGALSPESVVLILSYARDEAGNVFTAPRIADLIRNICKVPFYGVHSARLGHGIVGGSLLDGKAHGASAAKIGRRILAGERPSEIPVVMESTSRFMFDYRELERFGIPLSSLPEKAVLIHAPKPWLERNRTLVVGVVSMFPFLVACMVFLSLSVVKARKAETALRRSEAKYHNLLDTIQLIAVMLDRKGDITYCNDYLLRLAGRSKEEVLHGSWFDLFLPEENRKSVREMFESGISDGSLPAHYENEMVTRSGERRLIVWNNTVLHGPEGEVTGTASIGIDVTEHRDLEERLRQSRKMEAVGLLAGGIAHDFNNLLTVIIGYSDILILKMGEANPLACDAGEILKAAKLATSLTGQLLTFSRRQILNAEILDLNVIVANVAKMLRRLIGENISIGVDLCEDPWKVKADISQMEQIVLNLSVNAQDAMPKGGELAIGTRNVAIGPAAGREHADVAPGEYVELSVRDTGKGMDREMKSRIFEPFFTTKEVGKGTGLGLSTVYGIVNQSGGHILVHSEPGKGSKFSVFLPRTAEELLPHEGKTAAFAAILAGPVTVLVVEDSYTVRKMTCKILEIYGYKVLEAALPEDALGVCERHEGDIHLLLTDVVMPGMSGPDLSIKARRLRPAMKVLYMSGYTKDAIDQVDVSRGEIHFIQKPFSPESLAAKIEAVLNAD